MDRVRDAQRIAGVCEHQRDRPVDLFERGHEILTRTVRAVTYLRNEERLEIRLVFPTPNDGGEPDGPNGIRSNSVRARGGSRTCAPAMTLDVGLCRNGRSGALDGAHGLGSCIGLC